MPRSSASKSRSEFDVVVAVDSRMGIGREGTMPWHLPPDLQYFSKLTKGGGLCAVIMGRKTWESLPTRFRPLPQRRNWVISRQAHYAAPGARIANSLSAALEACAEEKLHQIFVIGGAQIYAEALRHPDCRSLFITEIDHDFDCQVFFPLNPQFQRQEWLGEGEYQGLRYRFTRWSKEQNS